MHYIGPHVSIKENISLAPGRAASLGATGFAIFTKNQRIWSAPKQKKEDAEAFRTAMKEGGFSSSSVLPHAGYLINPATPDEELEKKSLALFIDEAERTVNLGLSVINIHPGAYKEGDRNDGIKRAAKMIDTVLESVPGIRIAIENTAGAGTILGGTFEELDSLLSAINKLFGMHLNDSKVPLSSHKDRHESIGKGLIGKEPFLEITSRSDTENIPLILETPDESLWSNEIKLLSYT